GRSDYNDNCGIKMIVMFAPFKKAGKKRRANAKPATLSFIGYFHEDMPFCDWVVKLVETVKRRDLLEHSTLYNSDANSNNNSFTVTYTVPCRFTAEVGIESSDEYAELVEQAKNSDTAKEGARCKVFVTKHEIKEQMKEGTSCCAHAIAHAAWSSVLTIIGLSPEEKEQDEVIASLILKYCCNDRECSRTPCYVAGPNAQHVHLTHQHLRMWAAALVSSRFEC
ncbi:hypothetical protein DFP72DRAFT_831623, partial [Ephemerocybe angulata]